jgi:hypothetical protein
VVEIMSDHETTYRSGCVVIVTSPRAVRPWRARVVEDWRTALTEFEHHLAVLPLETGAGWSSVPVMVPRVICHEPGSWKMFAIPGGAL